MIGNFVSLYRILTQRPHAQYSLRKEIYLRTLSTSLGFCMACITILTALKITQGFLIILLQKITSRKKKTCCSSVFFMQKKKKKTEHIRSFSPSFYC